MKTFKLEELEKGPEALLAVLQRVNDQIALCEDAPLVLTLSGYSPVVHFIAKAGCLIRGNCNNDVRVIICDNGLEDQSYYGIYNQSDADRVLENIDRTAEFPDKIIKALESQTLSAQARPIKMVDLGVELEVEHRTRYQQSAVQSALSKIIGDMVDMVVSDGSVRGGHEIRFSHGTLSKWKETDVKGVMKWLRDKHFNNRTSTAGMHIHMSTDSIEATKYATRRCCFCKNAILDILYPICGRKAKIRGTVRLKHRYGIGSDFTRGFTRHNTLEIRVWEATLNPKVFTARLKFADYFMRFLCSEMPFSEFFNNMTLAEKKNYAYLVKTNNQHAFGMGKEAALKQLNMEA